MLPPWSCARSPHTGGPPGWWGLPAQMCLLLALTLLGEPSPWCVVVSGRPPCSSCRAVAAAALCAFCAACVFSDGLGAAWVAGEGWWAEAGREKQGTGPGRRHVRGRCSFTHPQTLFCVPQGGYNLAQDPLSVTHAVTAGQLLFLFLLYFPSSQECEGFTEAQGRPVPSRHRPGHHQPPPALLLVSRSSPRRTRLSLAVCRDVGSRGTWYLDLRVHVPSAAQKRVSLGVLALSPGCV